jgi:hypothetical protein
MSATVHSALPAELAREAHLILGKAGLAHVAHGDGDPVRAAEHAVEDADAVALLGPFRSAHVGEAAEVVVGTGLALLAPAATAAGVTRPDEPGGEPGSPRDGGVLRLIARDTVVAQRIAADVAGAGRRALVLAGDHEYGVQLDGQLLLVGLPRTDDPVEADLIVLCGLAGAPEIDAARALSPLPIVAFDGVQGAELGEHPDVGVALPFAPVEGVEHRDQFRGAHHTRVAAGLVVAAVRGGATGRAAVLAALRALGPFDAHGDPVDPPVWLWRADRDWRLAPEGPFLD